MKYVIGPVLLLAALAAGQTRIGQLDTIGGTTYDVSMICAGMQRLVYYDPGYGVHAAWCWSLDTSGTSFPDRNVRYNFRDEASGEWRWLDADYMQSGSNVFVQRAGYGALDVDPVSHAAVVSAHFSGSGGVCPEVARDIGPGAGEFERTDGEPVMGVNQWPWMAVSSSGAIHVLPMTAAYQLSYSRISAWPVWGPPQVGFEPSPGFPCHLITASKRSEKVSALWAKSDVEPNSAYLRTSEDGGLAWADPIDLGFPPAYGGDTVPGYHISSFGANYDRDDNLNIVAAVLPVIRDTEWTMPVEIWHYNAANNPRWNRVQRAGCDPANLHYSIGMQSIYAGRPKVGQDPATGRLCVIWSQFDSVNVEPVTSILRADVWCSTSSDGGYTWSAPVNLTGPDSCTHIYCDIAPVVNDTMHIVYMSDLIAGMFVLYPGMQGPATRNPIIYHRVPVSAVAVAESPERQEPARQVEPTLVRVLPAGATAFDALGRKVLNPKPGVYFVRDEGRGAGDAGRMRKVLVLR